MNYLEEYKHNLTTAAVAVVLGFAGKKLLGKSTINTSDVQHVLASFAVVGVASVVAEYAIDEKKKISHRTSGVEKMGYSLDK